MESLLQQVKSAELEDKRPSHRQPLQQSEGQHEGMLINASGFNSDLKDKPGKGVLTPEDVQLSARMNQTIAHFHSRHESKDRVMPPIVSKDYMTKQEQLTYRQHHDTLEHDQQQVSVIRPLNLKNFEDIETSRVVLYREDYREIFAPPDAKQPGSNFFVIEVSRSRYKLYIVAIKIPKQLLTQVLRGKRNVFNLAQHPRAKVYCLDITEKQAKKLLQECDNDFKTLVDKLYVRQGKLQIRDFDQLMHYGNPESSTVSLQQLNSYRIRNKALEVGGIVITNPDEVYMREQKLKEQYYSKPWRNTSNPPRKQKGFIFQPKETEGSPDPNQSIDQDDMRKKQSSMIVVNGNVMKKHFHRVKNTQQSISVPGKWDVIQSPISTNKTLERSRNEMEKSGNRRYETTQSNATTVQRDEVNTFIDKFIGKQ